MNTKLIIIVIIILIVGGFVFFQKDQLQQSANTETAGSKQPKYTFKGEGRQMLGPISLKKGLVIIQAKNLTGPNDTFSLNVVMDENGDGQISSGEGYTGVNINVGYSAAEAYNGKIALKASDADYFINVDGGRWEVAITQPEKTKDPAEKPTKFEGDGDMVTERFFLKEGITKFRATHKGKGVFSVYITDQDGNGTRYFVNEIGNVDTEFEYKNVFDDNYFFVVRASGPWSIEAK